jgi:uncharacterized membrane protein
MVVAYLLLKWLHVLLAITAVGSNLTYVVWITLAGGDPAAVAFALRGIRFLDRRIANPAYALLLVTGFAMVLIGGIPPLAPWLVAAYALYLALVVVGIAGFSPTARRQRQLAEALDVSSPEYRAVAHRFSVLGALALVLVVAIVFLMVTKLSF